MHDNINNINTAVLVCDNFEYMLLKKLDYESHHRWIKHLIMAISLTVWYFMFGTSVPKSQI